MLLIQRFWSDEGGFLISAELVLVSTICVLGLVVGLTEISVAIVGELNDVANAVGSLNQSFSFVGFSSISQSGFSRASVSGSIFVDYPDEGDNKQIIDILVTPSIGSGG